MFTSNIEEKGLGAFHILVVLLTQLLQLLILLFLSASIFHVVAQRDGGKRSVRICTELTGSPLEAAGETNRFWKKKVLSVGFLNGSEFVRRKVKQFAPEWSRFANIRFNFVDTRVADIRIAFKYKRSARANEDTGSWAVIGTGSQRILANRPTMNFGWFDESTADEEFRRTILHEFGHALGLIHEHQSPNVSIKWKEQEVINYYFAELGWSEQMVRDNIFRKYQSNQTQYSAYDPKSVMQYHVPKELTEGGFETGWNTNLSENDKFFVASVYPRVEVTIYKLTGRTETAVETTPLKLKNGDVIRAKFKAPFSGFLYVIANSIDGTFLLRPFVSSDEGMFTAGQIVTYGFRSTGGQPTEDIVFIFSPTKLTNATIKSMISPNGSKYDQKRMRLPNPVDPMPRTDGLNFVTALTCNYTKKWLAKPLAFDCEELNSNIVTQPVVFRLGYNNEN